MNGHTDVYSESETAGINIQKKTLNLDTLWDSLSASKDASLHPVDGHSEHAMRLTSAQHQTRYQHILKYSNDKKRDNVKLTKQYESQPRVNKNKSHHSNPQSLPFIRLFARLMMLTLGGILTRLCAIVEILFIGMRVESFLFLIPREKYNAYWIVIIINSRNIILAHTVCV